MRTFILAITAAATLSSAALTQEPSQRTASIPDFSGLWAHPSLNALEPLLSDPGPVRNRSRLRTDSQAGVGDIAQLVGDYTNPILQPWAAEVVKKFGGGQRRVSTFSKRTVHDGIAKRSAALDDPTTHYRPQSFSASRFTAGLFGFLILIQSGERPERYRKPRRF